MTPRVVVRDTDDALFLVMAVNTHTQRLIEANVAEARMTPDMADRMRLNLECIEITHYGCKLIDDISSGIELLTVPDGTYTPDTTPEKD